MKYSKTRTKARVKQTPLLIHFEQHSIDIQQLFNELNIDKGVTC